VVELDERGKPIKFDDKPLEEPLLDPFNLGNPAKAIFNGARRMGIGGVIKAAKKYMGAVKQVPKSPQRSTGLAKRDIIDGEVIPPTKALPKNNTSIVPRTAIKERASGTGRQIPRGNREKLGRDATPPAKPDYIDGEVVKPPKHIGGSVPSKEPTLGIPTSSPLGIPTSSPLGKTPSADIASGSQGRLAGILKYAKEHPIKTGLTIGSLGLTANELLNSGEDKKVASAATASPTDSSPSLKLLEGSDNGFVDNNGNIQYFEATDPTRNKILREKIAKEQAIRGSIAPSVLPSIYSDPANRPTYTAPEAQPTASENARAAILRRGLQLLDKADNTDKLNAVTNLLASAGASGRAPTQPSRTALQEQRDLVNLDIAKERLGQLKDKPTKVADIFSYGKLIDKLGSGGSFVGSDIAATLGLDSENAPMLFTNPEDATEVDPSMLRSLLLNARENQVAQDGLPAFLSRLQAGEQ